MTSQVNCDNINLGEFYKIKGDILEPNYHRFWEVDVDLLMCIRDKLLALRSIMTDVVSDKNKLYKIVRKDYRPIWYNSKLLEELINICNAFIIKKQLSSCARKGHTRKRT